MLKKKNNNNRAGRRGLLKHIRIYVFRGLLAIIPLGITVLAIKFLYDLIDNRLMGWVDKFLGVSVPGLGIVIILSFLYLLGLITSNVIGRKFLSILEKISTQIPIVKTTYNIGKQLTSTLTLPENQLFKRVVLVNYLKSSGIWTVGFVTGEMIDSKNDEKLLRVFIPTPPNPITGTIVIVRETETRDPGWEIDEALKMVISGGIIGPEKVG